MIKIQIPTDMHDILEEHWNWFKKSKCKEMSNGKCSGKLHKRVDLIEKEMDGDIDVEAIIKADYKTCCVYKKKLENITDEKRKKLSHYFGYSQWIDKNNEKDWNAYKYMQRLHVNVCPYCNKNEIDYSDNADDLSIPRSPFDHFFPKDKNPHLSCSLYNLIPCCHTCNLAKSNKATDNKDIIYPYEEEFGENGEFVLVDNKIGTKYKKGAFRNLIIDNSTVELDIKDSGLKERIIKANEIFDLEKRYSQKKDVIGNLIDKIYAFPDILCLMNSLNLFEDEKKSLLLFFELPRDDNTIYTYQKFKKDILKQLYGFKI